MHALKLYLNLDDEKCIYEIGFLHLQEEEVVHHAGKCCGECRPISTCNFDGIFYKVCSFVYL